jgi:hypothetical protein
MTDSEQSVSRTYQPPCDGQYLRFDYPNVGYVLDRLEDCTFRYDLDRELPIGAWIKLLTPKGNIFAVAEVDQTFTTTVDCALGDTVRVDDRSHPAENTDDLIQRLRSHYEDAAIGYNTVLTVVYFDVIQTGGAR